MAKHKTVMHLPAAPLPSPPPAPRLFAQLLVAVSELLAVVVFAVGLFAVASWIMAGVDVRSRAARYEPYQPAPAPRERLRCWRDYRYGEMCEPADRSPPVRRHYARDVY
jgi:hypothetical protein